nr:hypothetical protein PHYPA_028116 [Physcomitrium patens]
MMQSAGLPLQQQQEQHEESKPARVSCTSKLDSLWFCYSPVYQMTEYYREGTFDNCRRKWSELFDCISLKTKRADEIKVILEERGKQKPHIWKFRTPEEASQRWKEEFGHLQD